MGHLFTFEYNELRSNEARNEFCRNGLGDIISVFHRDAYADGFVVEDEDESLRWTPCSWTFRSHTQVCVHRVVEE